MDRCGRAGAGEGAEGLRQSVGRRRRLVRRRDRRARARLLGANAPSDRAGVRSAASPLTRPIRALVPERERRRPRAESGSRGRPASADRPDEPGARIRLPEQRDEPRVPARPRVGVRLPALRRGQDPALQGAGRGRRAGGAPVGDHAHGLPPAHDDDLAGDRLHRARVGSRDATSDHGPRAERERRARGGRAASGAASSRRARSISMPRC